MMPSQRVALIIVSITLGVTLACAPANPSLPPTREASGTAVSAAGPEASATSGVGIRPIGSPSAAGSPAEHVATAASPSPGTADAVVAVVVAEAARQTGAVASEVTVERVEVRSWPDRSLGCPKPGVGYAQVITPGYLIVVQVRGQRLEYHTDQEQAIRCEL